MFLFVFAAFQPWVPLVVLTPTLHASQLVQVDRRLSPVTNFTHVITTLSRELRFESNFFSLSHSVWPEGFDQVR
mgnify:CR=1 FL=1